MMKYIKYFYFTFISVLLFSCYEDEGNYNYNEVPKIQIDSIKAQYEVTGYVTTLEITPEIKDPEKYEYVWRIYEVSSTQEPVDTVGFEKNISKILNYNMGTYKLILEVKDIKTGYTEYKSTNITVKTVFSTGFYIFKEENGMGDLDFYNNNNLSENLIEKMQGKKMSGKPMRLSILGNYSYFAQNGDKKTYKPTIIPITDDGMQMLSLDDLSVIYTLDNVFYKKPTEKIIPLHFLQSGAQFLSFMTDKGVYFTNLYQMPGSGKFGNPLPSTGGYELSNYCLNGGTHGFGAVFFDKKNGRFLNVGYNGGSLVEYNDAPDDEINSKGINMNLLYMGGFVNNGTAVFETKDKTERYIYGLKYDMGGAMMASNPVVSERTYKVDGGLLFNNAKVFGNNFAIDYLYFSTGDNNVHIFDCPNRAEIKNIATYGAGEEVTYIGNVYWSYVNDKGNNFNYLMVATHKGGEYTLYMYETLAGRPDLEKTPIVVKGKGKVVNVQYTSSLMGRNVCSRRDYSFY